MTNLLSQEDVDALPHRSRVCIRWSGGNGPFQYTVVHRNNRTYTLRKLPGGEEYIGGEVEYVGERSCRTWVWLPSGTAPAGVTGLKMSGGMCRGCESCCPVGQPPRPGQL